MFYILLATYGSVFLCEWLGDKNLYTITSLTMRFRAHYVFCGFTVAFMIKMAIAVLVGQAITELPTNLLTITSTITFFITALVIWFRRNDDRETTMAQHSRNFSRAALTAFAAILFSEWGDVGQIMAATLTVRYRLPLLVWIAATLALLSKGLLALLIGHGLRNRIPVSFLRPVCASLCIIMGIISAVEPIFRR